MKPGRVTAFTPEIAKEICDRIADGEFLKDICADERMPPESTVRTWHVTDFQGFAALYARAREIQADRWFDQIEEIANDGTNDWMERQRETKGVKWVENQEAINRSRLRVDTLKWKLAKVLPKKYGDKIVQEHGITNEFGEFLKRVAEQGRSIHGQEEKG